MRSEWQNQLIKTTNYRNENQNKKTENKIKIINNKNQINNKQSSKMKMEKIK